MHLERLECWRGIAVEGGEKMGCGASSEAAYQVPETATEERAVRPVPTPLNLSVGRAPARAVLCGRCVAPLCSRGCCSGNRMTGTGAAGAGAGAGARAGCSAQYRTGNGCCRYEGKDARRPARRPEERGLRGRRCKDGGRHGSRGGTSCSRSGPGMLNSLRFEISNALD